MPVYIDSTGFPVWGNLSPQKPARIPGGQVSRMIEDASINQIPGGRVEEVPLKQIPRPKQAQAEGASAGDLQEVGKFGTDLFDTFMRPYIQAPRGTP